MYGREPDVPEPVFSAYQFCISESLWKPWGGGGEHTAQPTAAPGRWGGSRGQEGTGGRGQEGTGSRPDTPHQHGRGRRRPGALSSRLQAPSRHRDKCLRALTLYPRLHRQCSGGVLGQKPHGTGGSEPLRRGTKLGAAGGGPSRPSGRGSRRRRRLTAPPAGASARAGRDAGRSQAAVLRLDRRLRPLLPLRGLHRLPPAPPPGRPPPAAPGPPRPAR